jgi:tetratricopeptide (TPR) repeat protein
MTSINPADARIAAGFLEDALEPTPNCALAHAHLAHCHEIFFMFGGFDEVDRAAAIQHARVAITSGTDDPTALAVAAFVIIAVSKDQETALNTIERALSLNASCAVALYFGALVYAFSGDSSAAVAHADRALRLSPFDPLSYLAHEAYGMAAVGQSRLDEAASHFGRAAQGNTGLGIIDLYHAAVLALAGRVEEARPIARRGLELMPGWRVRMFLEIGMAAAVADKFREGARLLRLPE